MIDLIVDNKEHARYFVLYLIYRMD